MPFCPDCRAEYRPGFSVCSDCRTALVDELPVASLPEEDEPNHDEWVVAYEGPTGAVKVIENRLRAMLVPCVVLPTSPQPLGALAEYDTPHLVISRVLVPPEFYEANRRAIEVAVVTGTAELGEVDAAAVAEAEEDYDVRACPDCAYFFHDSYHACPGCGAELVPAVEIFEDGQVEPDRVVVYHGDEAATAAVAGRLQAAGFAAESFGVEDWPVFAADVPWQELINRTREAEAVLAGAAVPPPPAPEPPPTARLAAAEADPPELEPSPAAEAEAEEDFDVRACPDCGYFFHDFFTACPGCGAALVPGVEIFEPGQLEPDRVIVAVGEEAHAQALAGRLQGAGFAAEAFGVEDWPVFAVDVPWTELTDRTAEVERLARA